MTRPTVPTWTLAHLDATTAGAALVARAHTEAARPYAITDRATRTTATDVLEAATHLARHLATATDTVQHARDGHTDRTTPAYATYATAVLTALDAHPVPWHTAHHLRGIWRAELTAHAGAIADLTHDLATGPHT